MRCLACLLAVLPAAAPAAEFRFCWVGAGGYAMAGSIAFPDALLGTGLIGGADIDDLRIVGYRDGVPVGRWSLAERTPRTTFVLSFDTDRLEFPVGGGPGSYQAWNANGQVNDCGPGGFGFNAGNWMQDVCIDNTYVTASSIDRFTPLPVQPADAPFACPPALLLGSLDPAVPGAA